MNNSSPPQVNPHLLDLLRCPVALREHGDEAARLKLVHDGWWLFCEASGYKYPVRDGIPQMLVEEGAKWQQTDVAALPVPPPDEA